MNQPQPPKIFLTAEWRWLTMLNYEVPPEVLAPHVPTGTELDSWNGKTFISVVGFLFLKTRVKGIAIPFHQNFEEVNLRFYVRHKAEAGWRRGVVFLRELVPRSAIAFVARTFYNENYIALGMTHRLETEPPEKMSASYSWYSHGRESHMTVEARGTAQRLTPGSLAEFIAEHYWGYARQLDGSTKEYQVEHPPWKIWEATAAQLEGDVTGLGGEAFRKYLMGPPSSAFLADGSAVTVSHGIKI